jgi:hypothetical protein
MPKDTNKNNTLWDRKKEWQNELQYHNVSTYLCAWYKEKKNNSPIELGVWPRTLRLMPCSHDYVSDPMLKEKNRFYSVLCFFR